jgi:hypothetical protein
LIRHCEKFFSLAPNVVLGNFVRSLFPALALPVVPLILPSDTCRFVVRVADGFVVGLTDLLSDLLADLFVRSADGFVIRFAVGWLSDLLPNRQFFRDGCVNERGGG